MTNFIISFLILADKFFGKLKATPVKVLVYFFAFGGCFYLFVQWNTVPTISTEVDVNSYRTTTNDKASISLKLQKNYNRLSDFGNNSLRLIINFGSAPDTITHFLKQGESAKVDSLLVQMRKYNSNMNFDSCFCLFDVKVKNEVDAGFGLRLKTEEPLNVQKKGILVTTGYHKKDGKLFYEGEAMIPFQFKLNPKFKSQFPYPIFGEITINGDWKSNIWTMIRTEDIAQCYYDFKLNTEGMNLNSGEIHELEIDFGGATRFIGINPQPDYTTMSGFGYTDSKKIEQISFKGLKTYCQFVETSGIQSVRVYLLTAICSLFFTLFVKTLVKLIADSWGHWIMRQNK